MPVSIKGEPERLKIPESEPLHDECHHFLQCISNGKYPITDGNEGLRVLKILNTAQRSLDNDGCKIQLFHSRTSNLEPQTEAQSAFSPLTSSFPSGINNTFHRGEAFLQPTTDIEGCFVHETTIIDKGCEIGIGTRIWHFSHILSGSKIGENCNIGQNVVVGPDVSIGKDCKIQNNVSVYKGVTLEDGVFCGPSLVFTNIYNPRAEIRKMDQVRSTFVKHGATLGANATIVCGVTIGRYVFVGAGAVVIHNVPDHALMVGNPARQIGWACACGERLTDDLECLTCGKWYTKNEQGIVSVKNERT